MKSNRTNRGQQQGAALVETVVISPLLLFLVLLTAEVTNAYVDHNTLTKYSRNAARYLSANALAGTTGTIQLDPQLITETRNLAVFGNTAGAGSPILPGLAPGNVQVTDLGNDHIRVTTTYAYTGLLGGSLPNFGFGPDSSLAFNLQATVVMRGL